MKQGIVLSGVVQALRATARLRPAFARRSAVTTEAGIDPGPNTL